MRSLINAQMEADVSEIAMKREIAEKEARKRIAEIEDQAHIAHERAVSDANFYASSKEAEANRARLTPEYLKYTEILAMANNSKIFFGEDIPSVFVEQGGKAGADVARGACRRADEGLGRKGWACFAA